MQFMPYCKIPFVLLTYLTHTTEISISTYFSFWLDIHVLLNPEVEKWHKSPKLFSMSPSLSKFLKQKCKWALHTTTQIQLDQDESLWIKYKYTVVVWMRMAHRLMYLNNSSRQAVALLEKDQMWPCWRQCVNSGGLRGFKSPSGCVTLSYFTSTLSACVPPCSPPCRG